MNKEQDYASDTDESDEDFRPDQAAGESPVSEEDEEEDCESNEELTNGTQNKEKPEKRRKQIKKLTKKKKSKAEQEEETDEDDDHEAVHSRRATRQTNDGETNGKNGKSLEKDELVSDEEDKSRTNALWADFLKDVKPTAAAATTKANNPSKVVEEDKPSSSSSKDQTESKKSNIASVAQTPKVEETKVVVTEVVDFAGEEVRIQREVDATSIKENKAATIPPAKKQPFGRIMPGGGIKRTIPTAATGSGGGGAGGGGLGSLLNQLGKKKKLSVLEKSQMDWKSFKQTEGIDEQLQTFNKGKDGYLERQDFLQRTDLRQFEIEKNLRQTTRRPH